MQALIDLGDGHGDGEVSFVSLPFDQRVVGSALFVPVGGKDVRWLTQLLEHSDVASPLYSESPLGRC